MEDVLVIGGGPTGMTAAGDLALRGRAVTVLERWPQINPASRAFVTMPRTLEVLDSRGLADDLLATGTTTAEIRLFGGATMDLSRLPSHYPFGLITPQTNVDQALGRYATAAGATIRRGVEAAAVTQDDDGVTVTAASGEVFHARYLVAADGAHSTVRRLLRQDFPGSTVLSSVVLADVRLAHGPAGGALTLGDTADCFGFLVPYGRGDWFRAMTWDRGHQVGDAVPVEREEIVRVLNRAMGRDVGVLEVGWHSRFHCEERQLRAYRKGRVFFAGDAAHVHSPMGGQGMNTGIQDAANLAWKIDAVLGGAGDAVLDTYHAERHPIGRRVLLQSGLMMRSVTTHPAGARWLRDHLAPPALRLVRDQLAGSFAGTGLRYTHRRGEHKLVGTRATEVPLAEGRLTELQRRPGFLLVRSAAGPAVPPGLLTAERTDAGPALLVRPDGYIAWAGEDGWAPVLRRWTAHSEEAKL
ncbi:FAD-dependent monooxygenase [Symbioplanes lichenis]|uniref:FAD-dependent monooxygenase n=1 Tax=Symbioplanes lichenis TaxID=1629072 RepID=UPI0027384590|nr:FAD-dependent monooxygenase [Actinoplanes lichenis]